ncbi:hypothetical protein TNIN_358691 [Trichonephila inaurata madagascariensis]|uniref:Uncharacterized protein n=1 Tax=Trichonephila inaurata madagascariensis TaxID=2747483 RepID=A0A8X6YBX9_9ARAC|nr:hypothetical protein TNIN_358691 [Trichonephila inaurata madagascariensis]
MEIVNIINPVLLDTKRCGITSRNHGFAVDAKFLLKYWLPLFTNANDHSNEDLEHLTNKWMFVVAAALKNDYSV